MTMSKTWSTYSANAWWKEAVRGSTTPSYDALIKSKIACYCLSDNLRKLMQRLDRMAAH